MSRGIGSVTPPGPAACGNAAPPAQNATTQASLSQAGGGFTSGRFIIKVYRPNGGLLSPFTGATDPGGYFFLPAIPAGEPYRAVAVDTATGASRTFEGVSSTTGQPAYMFFDFSDATDTSIPFKIGDTVSNGVPRAGAGNLETPGAVDLYTFTGQANQRVIFELITRSADLFALEWTLKDPSGKVIFDMGMFSQPISTLPASGTYTLAVSEQYGTHTGTYSFRIFGIPASDEFTIGVGDVVSNGAPSAGAGNIEVPYVNDIYHISTGLSNRLRIEVLGRDPGLARIQCVLIDAAGIAVINQWLPAAGRTLVAYTPTVGPSAGPYTIYIGDDGIDGPDGGTGTYSFRVTAVPLPQQFAIIIGDTISDGAPNSGAGNIETPGAIDTYTFTATAGQQIFLDALSSSVSRGNLDWKIIDPNGTQLRTDAFFQDSGPITLSTTGTYSLSIFGTYDNDEVGTYSFKLWNVPAPQQFAIAIGDTVSNGAPAAGAGNIETPGVVDRYTFTATAGQQVNFDALSNSVGFTSLIWSILDSNGNLVGTTYYFSNTGPITLTAGGTYTLVVDASGDLVPTYSFKLR
jgi:hypothetical protein